MGAFGAGQFRCCILVVGVTVVLVLVAGRFRWDILAMGVTVVLVLVVRAAELICASRTGRGSRKAKSLSLGDGLCIAVAKVIPRLLG